jgi:hypothetical protein
VDAKQKEEIRKSHYQKIGQSAEKQNYYLIFSRHPIDIVRMSDFRPGKTTDGTEITSCHSPGDSYYASAKLDAKFGGGIVYLVKQSDLKDVDLQEDEVFTDNQRDVEGISPIARVRLRRFTHKDGDHDLVVPEDGVYGDQGKARAADFADLVLNWAKEVQAEKVGEKPRMRDYRLRGGYYRDSSDSSLWNRLFDTEEKGDTEYGFPGEESENEDYQDSHRGEIYRVEMAKFHQKYNRQGGKFQHYPLVQTEYEIYDPADYGDENGVVYLKWQGRVELRIPDQAFSVKIMKDIANAIGWGEISRGRLPIEVKSLIDRIFSDKKNLKNFLKSNRFENFNVSTRFLPKQGAGMTYGYLEIVFNVEDENYRGQWDQRGFLDYHDPDGLNPDRYEEFMRDTVFDIWDTGYDRLTGLMQNWLSMEGLTKTTQSLSLAHGYSKEQEREFERESERKQERDQERDFGRKYPSRKILPSPKLQHFRFEGQADPDNEDYGQWEARKQVYFDLNLPGTKEQMDKVLPLIKKGWNKEIDMYSPPFEKMRDLVALILQPRLGPQQLTFNFPSRQPRQYRQSGPEGWPHLELKIYHGRAEDKTHETSSTMHLTVLFEANPATKSEAAREQYRSLLKFDERWPIFERKARDIILDGLQKILGQMHQPWWSGYPQGKTQEPPYYKPQYWPLFRDLEPRMPWAKNRS